MVVILKLEKTSCGGVLTALAVFIAACASTPDVLEPPPSEDVGPWISRLEAPSQHSLYGAVATATPDATRIAVEILEAGGNAIDAAVAAAFALGVSDPGDCGLGGTTYILIRFADGRATAIDGSAVVPLRVNRGRLAELEAEGLLRGMELAAVPATVAALDYATTAYGTRPLAELIEPSTALALRGYRATPFQEVSLRTYFDDILSSAFLRHFMLEDGERPPSVETLQCRPILARTLGRISAGGSSEFYRGSIAAEIEADMTARGGFVSRDDLGIFRVREVAPLRGSYRDTEVLAFPYPSAGGAVIEALNILGEFSAELLRENTAQRHQVVAEAFHLATVDHERLLADPSGFGERSREHLLSRSLALERAALISVGRPVASDDEYHRIGGEDNDGNTTQISIVDRWGNAVSLTQSIGRFFGNKALTPGLGFPYNSLLEGAKDFDARSPIPTSMCPTIVARDGEVLLVLGSGSSSRIPGIVATVISNMVDRGLDLRSAVLAPRILWNTGKEPGIYAEIFTPISEQQIAELEAFGYETKIRVQLPVRQSQFSRFGSVNAVHLDRLTRMLTGVGDPRRNGHALGARL